MRVKHIGITMALFCIALVLGIGISTAATPTTQATATATIGQEMTLIAYGQPAITIEEMHACATPDAIALDTGHSTIAAIDATRTSGAMMRKVEATYAVPIVAAIFQAADVDHGAVRLVGRTTTASDWRRSDAMTTARRLEGLPVRLAA